MLRYLLLLSFVSFVGGLFGQLSNEQLREIDSLKIVVDSNVHDSIKLDALLLWDSYIYMYDTELDKELNQKVISICDEGLKKSNLTSTELRIYLDAKAIASNNIGLVYYEYGNYKEALENFQINLQIGEHFNDSLKISNAYNNMGMIYKNLFLNDKALQYYQMSFDYAPKDDYTISTYYNNIGICYEDMKQYDLALECYHKSLTSASLSNNLIGIGNTYFNIAIVYSNLQQYDSALIYNKKAMEVYGELSDYSGLSFSKKGIAYCYYHQNKLNEAEAFGLDALKDGETAHNLLSQKESAYALYEIKNRKKDYLQALNYLELYVVLKDSIQGAEKNEEIIKLDFDFNMERQRLQDSLEYSSQQQLQKIKYESVINKKQTTQYVLYGGIGVCVVIGFLIFRGYIRKKKDHEIIALQKNEVELQKHIVEEKNKEITDSINYAKRIQDAILPSSTFMNEMLPENFILYLPKDIVAGDFYWLEDLGDKVVFAVADCTGHGVPGAMVSVVCHNALNRAVHEFNLTDPGKILDKTRLLVADTFEDESLKSKSENTIRDGMDIGLCVFYKNTGKLFFAGANNGLYHISENNLVETNPDKQPIGKYAEEKPFTTKEITLKKGDVIYLYTDGYADQFGGAEGKKYKYKQLKNTLIQIHHESMHNQKNFLHKAFFDWKGSLEQIDDVCLMGIRF